MQLLLDTHVVLWALADDPALPDAARDLITDERNSIWVSAVSIWEIAIKHGLGRGDMPLSGLDALRYCLAAGDRCIDLRAEHAGALLEFRADAGRAECGIAPAGSRHTTRVAIAAHESLTGLGDIAEARDVKPIGPTALVIGIGTFGQHADGGQRVGVIHQVATHHVRGIREPVRESLRFRVEQELRGGDRGRAAEHHLGLIGGADLRVRVDHANASDTP